MSALFVRAARAARDLDECKVLVALASYAGAAMRNEADVSWTCLARSADLCGDTGLPPERIEAVFGRLAREGCIERLEDHDVGVGAWPRYRVRLRRAPYVARPFPAPAPDAPPAAMPTRRAGVLRRWWDRLAS